MTQLSWRNGTKREKLLTEDQSDRHSNSEPLMSCEILCRTVSLWRRDQCEMNFNFNTRKSFVLFQKSIRSKNLIVSNAGLDIELYFYHPPTKLREGNVFKAKIFVWCHFLSDYLVHVPSRKVSVLRPLSTRYLSRGVSVKGVFVKGSLWRGSLLEVQSLKQAVLLFLKFFGGKEYFLWGHWYPCNGLLVSKSEWAALFMLGRGTVPQ